MYILVSMLGIYVVCKHYTGLVVGPVEYMGLVSLDPLKYNHMEYYSKYVLYILTDPYYILK